MELLKRLSFWRAYTHPSGLVMNVMDFNFDDAIDVKYQSLGEQVLLIPIETKRIGGDNEEV